MASSPLMATESCPWNGAEWAALFLVQANRAGRLLRISDALIAGIAKANDLTIATRNVRDFDGLDVAVFNPWEQV